MSQSRRNCVCVFVSSTSTLITLRGRWRDGNERKTRADRQEEADFRRWVIQLWEASQTLPETSWQSWHAQLCDGIHVCVFVCLCVCARAERCSCAFQSERFNPLAPAEGPAQQSPSRYPLIPSAVPPSGPVAATSQSTCVCESVTRLASRKGEDSTLFPPVRST